MTIPSRPAPAPPSSRAQNAAAGANASLEQLRLQLQQQHLQQQQASNGGLQKLSIKLPPPPRGAAGQQHPLPKRSTGGNNNNSIYDVEGSMTGSSITRRFPQARYTPATNWNDAPFDSAAATVNGNNCKKMPPPRPPPPKVQINGRKLASLSNGPSGPAGGGGGSIISNIFHRKKSTATATAAASKAAAQSRVYGLSSGHAASTTTMTASASATASATASSNYTTSSNIYDWNAAWNTASTTTTTTTTKLSSGSQREADAQLISFDSPPSSPTFTQKSNSDCVSVDSFSSDSNFSSPNNGSVSQPESGFEDDYHARSRPATQSPLVDPWEAVDCNIYSGGGSGGVDSFGAAPVRQIQPQLGTRSSDNPLCNGKSLLPPTQSLTMPTIIKPKISQKPKAPKPPPFIGHAPVFAYGNGQQLSPPMPKCAPPMLPATAISAPSGNISLLDVISGKVDALALSNGSSGYVEDTELPYAIALYDFDGVEEGDLSFRENEKIYLLEQPTEEWYRGRTRSGCEGLFPVNYVETMVPLGGSAPGAAQMHTHAQQQPQQQQPQQQQPQQQQQQLSTARCLYNFPGEVEGDLTLRENELVNVLYRINEDWLYGEVDGRQGQFPANFLEYVPDNLPTL